MKDIQSGIFVCLIFFACSKQPVDEETGITLLNPTAETFDPRNDFHLSVHLEDEYAIGSYLVEITNSNGIPIFYDEGALNHSIFDLNYHIDLSRINQNSIELYIKTKDLHSRTKELKRVFYSIK